MNGYGKLYLIPVPIAGEQGLRDIPSHNISVINGLSKFIAEDARNARRFLKQCEYPDISKAEILLLNEHSKEADISALLKDLLDGHSVGLMSDAGCPGIADPGADVVYRAHQKHIEVIPLTGPSSIVLSIMSSGFNGQNFAFVGYLPIDKQLKTKRLRELEQISGKYNQAQFFIETPYRNEQMMETLLDALSPGTHVFVGIDIHSPKQQLVSKTVNEWKSSLLPYMHKVPAVFGIYKKH
ncbi:MAG: SAM-dependent methyltransferase [Bacteroidia bacterium]|nr:SAM-dependent methyltransferase [Bacteroidia bacterium]